MASGKKTASWTVMVLRPDYIADEFGKDTFLYNPRCECPKRAIRLTQLAAARADGAERSDASNYHCVICVQGVHMDYSWLAE